MFIVVNYIRMYLALSSVKIMHLQKYHALNTISMKQLCIPHDVSLSMFILCADDISEAIV